MIALFALAVFTSQLGVLAQSWMGALAPDPFVLPVALAGLHLPRRRLLGAALALGWGRALVMLEPAGAHVLAALAALALVEGLRVTIDRRGTGALLSAALLVAGCWSLAGLLLGWIDLRGAPAPPSTLLLGASLAWLLARPARRAADLAWSAA